MINPQQSHSYHPHLHSYPHFFGFRWISLSFTHTYLAAARSKQSDPYRMTRIDILKSFQKAQCSLHLSPSLPPVAVPPLWSSFLLEIQGHGKSICVTVCPHSAECAPTGLAVCFQTRTHKQAKATPSLQPPQTKSQPRPQPLHLSVRGWYGFEDKINAPLSILLSPTPD